MLARIPLISLCTLVSVASLQGMQLPQACEKVVDYDIDVSLAEDGRTIEGDLHLRWTNRIANSTDHLMWHVYNNAWQDKDSVFMREAYLMGDKRLPRDWGSTEISQVRLFADDGTEHQLSWEWVKQELSESDQTVMRIDLPQAIGAGETIEVRLHFKTLLPPAYRRSGADGVGGYVHAVQWFPKIGVFELKDGQGFWNCEPYHYLTEFYADYGSWKLRLSLPERFADKVAASGTQLPNVEKSPGRVTYTFLADDIHDFAWTADPDFEVHRHSFHQLMRDNKWRNYELEDQLAKDFIGEPGFEHITSKDDLYPRDTEVILMLQPEHEEYASEYLEATAKSLYYFGLLYGEYPYETISVIDPAHNARATGGMEYPRLFTGGVRKGAASRTLNPEGITVHEFGHQFWYGLVGNDEFNHAWLDEGFNSFSTQRIERDAWEQPLATYSVLGKEYYGKAPASLPSYGEGNALALLSMQRLETPDLGFMPAMSYELRRDTSLTRWLREIPPISYYPEVEIDSVRLLRGTFDSTWSDALAKPTYKLLDGRMRRINAYTRPALTLETFSRLMGESNWNRVIRAYHEDFRFKHPQPNDFFNSVIEYAADAKVNEVPLPWNDIWQHAYHQNDVLDYGVHRLVCEESLLNANNWDVTVEVRRLGEFAVPVEVQVNWSDGSSELITWDGKDPWLRKTWSNHPLKPKSVVVDPFRRLMLDRNWMNNSRLLEVDEKRAYRLGLRALLWAQQSLHYAGGMG